MTLASSYTMLAYKKVKFGDLTSVEQNLMHYFDTPGGDISHHNITPQYHHQEAI